LEALDADRVSFDHTVMLRSSVHGHNHVLNASVRYRATGFGGEATYDGGASEVFMGFRDVVKVPKNNEGRYRGGEPLRGCSIISARIIRSRSSTSSVVTDAVVGDGS
jgi:hypothetical protein